MDEFEKNEQSVEETVNAQETTADVSENTVEVAEDTSEIAENAVEAAKPKVKVQTPIIVAACIVVAAVLAFACFKVFFNNSIVGTWVLASDATADEASGDEAGQLRYYTFEKDGTATISLGTMKVVGNWSYANSDSSTTDQEGDTVTVSISYFFNGTFNVDLGGNSLTGRTLKMTSDSYTLDFVSASLPNNKLEPDKNFKPVDEVVGKWKNSDYNLTYTFNEDGTCNLNQVDTLLVDGTYTVNEKEGTIEITYMESSEGKMSIEYSVDGDSKITFSGLEYKKVTE